MKKTLKTVFTLSIAVTFLLSASLNVSAAGVRDIFDAELYAQTYPDLAVAFGHDEEALYQHYISCGIAEGRIASTVLDIAKYRDMYPDLAAAFGDNWDAYADHYLTCGIAEGRSNGIGEGSSLSQIIVTGQTREQLLEQIYVSGDYKTGSIYGPRLKKTELDQVAEAVLQFVEFFDWTDMDDFTKVFCAHQYLCAVCDYAPDWSKNQANTAWGALVYGEAQCSGYARAFKALCDAIGIGCYYVHADENAFNPSHQWNEVCVDGNWYIIDVQCNDSSGFPAVYLVSGATYAYYFGMSWNHDGLPDCPADYNFW